MLVFKENVYGFVYDSQFGNVTYIIQKPLNEETIDVIKNSIDEDYDVLFTNIEDVREMFEITSKEDLENDEEGFNEVLDFI